MAKDLFMYAIIFSFLYLWLGRVGRADLIDRGWYKEDASIILEILLAPLFAIYGVFLFFGIITFFTALQVIFGIPVLILLAIFLAAIGFRIY